MQLFQLLGSILYALFLWWFLTGVIVVVYGRSPRVKHLYFAIATIIMMVAMVGLALTRQQTQPSDVYLALTCGILIWGWHVASYYLGYVTGPHTEEDLRQALQIINGSQNNLFIRFRHALQASLFHELLVIGFMVLMAGITWNAPNKWGLWIFVVLWMMHSLAKINVFLGVRNFHIEFLPTHLHYLGSLLGKRTNNLLLPLTVMMASVTALVHFYQGIVPGTTPAQTVGFLAVGTLITLGVVEHLLLVLPIPAILWGWGLRALPQHQHQTGTQSKRHTSLQNIIEQVVKG